MQSQVILVIRSYKYCGTDQALGVLVLDRFRLMTENEPMV